MITPRAYSTIRQPIAQGGRVGEADIGANIRDARERKRLTQKELAERVGVAANTIALWERGEQTPKDPFQLVTLARTLDTTVEALVDSEALRSAHREAFMEGMREAAEQVRGWAKTLDAWPDSPPEEDGRPPTLPRRGPTPEADRKRKGA